MAQYLVDHAAALSTNTLRQRLAALAQWHQAHGFADPTAAVRVKQTLKGIQALHPAREKRAAPLQLTAVTHVSDWLDAAIEAAIQRGDRADALRCCRDRAMLLLGFWRASDIQPDTVHGDTQAQNFPVFGLAHLLGIDLMPRIRNIKDLALSKPDPQASYPHIQALFGDGSIDWKLIETHLHDMLRVAVSIKTGKISTSTILHRLGNYSRKNKLYFAFKELGRVIRTLFLLRYIDDVEVRKTIQGATNKSEEFNNFTKWAFFGGQGIIAENVLHEQQKIVGYNHLVANPVILHNVEQMSRVLAELRDEGIDISPEVLAGLSPYRTSHINRFGDYTVDTNREITPIDFARRILRAAEEAAAAQRDEEEVLEG